MERIYLTVGLRLRPFDPHRSLVMRGQKRVEDARKPACVPRIDVFGERRKRWMAGTSLGQVPALPTRKVLRYCRVTELLPSPQHGSDG
jgi:hypothetical protein